MRNERSKTSKVTKVLKGKHEPLTSVSTGLNEIAWNEGSISGDLVVAIEMTNAASQINSSKIQILEQKTHIK